VQNSGNHETDRVVRARTAMSLRARTAMSLRPTDGLPRTIAMYIEFHSVRKYCTNYFIQNPFRFVWRNLYLRQCALSRQPVGPSSRLI